MTKQGLTFLINSQCHRQLEELADAETQNIGYRHENANGGNEGVLGECHIKTALVILSLHLVPSSALPQYMGTQSLTWDTGVKVVMYRRLQLLSPHRRFSGIDGIDSSMNFTS